MKLSKYTSKLLIFCLSAMALIFGGRVCFALDYYTGEVSVPEGVVLVSPTNMTSDVLPVPYVLTSSGVQEPAYACYLSFDGVVAGARYTYLSHSPSWLTLDFGVDNKQIITGLRFQAVANGSNEWKYFKISGSNDCASWVALENDSVSDLYSDNDLEGSAFSNYFAFDNTIEYRYYYIQLTQAYGSTSRYKTDTIELYADLPPPGDIPFEFCAISTDVIDLGEYNNFYGCSAENGYWDMFQQKCFEYDCTDVSWSYEDLYGYDMLCDVDLDDELEEYTTSIPCILAGGYWFQETCFAMECGPGYSSSDFGFDSDYSTSTLADLEVPVFLGMFISDDMPERLVQFIEGFRTIVMERFPFNVLTQYIAFWFEVYSNITETDVPFALEADMSFFPNSPTSTYTVVDFDIAGLSDSSITIFGMEFESFYSFARSLMRFFLAIAFGAYCVRFANRLFSNTI